MVWMGGTRTGKTGFTGVGLSAGGLSIGGGKGKTSSQSHLAAACAPPKSSIMPTLIPAVLFVLFWVPLFSTIISAFSAPRFFDGFFSFIIAAPLLALLSYGLYRLYKYLNENQKKVERDYARTWVCLKCGSKFIPF